MAQNLLHREVRVINNDEFMNRVIRLAQYIQNYPRTFDTVYGVPKNGTIVASLLAKLLNIRFVNNVVTTKTLIVDDISDMGVTLNPFRTRYPDNIIATIYFRANTDIMPDIVVEDAKDAWLKFPFEVFEREICSGDRKDICNIGYACDACPHNEVNQDESKSETDY